jgi:hypothetical protein
MLNIVFFLVHQDSGYLKKNLRHFYYFNIWFTYLNFEILELNQGHHLLDYLRLFYLKLNFLFYLLLILKIKKKNKNYILFKII